MLSDLVVLRRSVAATSWKTASTSSADNRVLNGDVVMRYDITGSLYRRLRQLTTPPSDASTPISDRNSHPKMITSQAPLTLDDLRPLPANANNHSHSSVLPPHSKPSGIQKQGVRSSALRTRAQEVLAKYSSRTGNGLSKGDSSVSQNRDSLRSSSPSTEGSAWTRPLSYSPPSIEKPPLRRIPSYTEVLEKRTDDVLNRSFRH